MRGIPMIGRALVVGVDDEVVAGVSWRVSWRV